MAKIDPRVKPNLWLSAVICDLIDQNTAESLAAAKDATSTISQWLEPGLIDDLFAPWIEEYLKLMEADQSTGSN
jgi:hypothetical protein